MGGGAVCLNWRPFREAQRGRMDAPCDVARLKGRVRKRVTFLLSSGEGKPRARRSRLEKATHALIAGPSESQEAQGERMTMASEPEPQGQPHQRKAQAGHCSGSNSGGGSPRGPPHLFGATDEAPRPEEAPPEAHQPAVEVLPAHPSKGQHASRQSWGSHLPTKEQLDVLRQRYSKLQAKASASAKDFGALVNKTKEFRAQASLLEKDYLLAAERIRDLQLCGSTDQDSEAQHKLIQLTAAHRSMDRALRQKVAASKQMEALAPAVAQAHQLAHMEAKAIRSKAKQVLSGTERSSSQQEVSHPKASTPQQLELRQGAATLPQQELLNSACQQEPLSSACQQEPLNSACQQGPSKSAWQQEPPSPAWQQEPLKSAWQQEPLKSASTAWQQELMCPEGPDPQQAPLHTPDNKSQSQHAVNNKSQQVVLEAADSHDSSSLQPCLTPMHSLLHQAAGQQSPTQQQQQQQQQQQHQEQQQQHQEQQQQHQEQQHATQVVATHSVLHQTAGEQSPPQQQQGQQHAAQVAIPTPQHLQLLQQQQQRSQEPTGQPPGAGLVPAVTIPPASTILRPAALAFAAPSQPAYWQTNPFLPNMDAGTVKMSPARDQHSLPLPGTSSAAPSLSAPPMFAIVPGPGSTLVTPIKFLQQHEPNLSRSCPQFCESAAGCGEGFTAPKVMMPVVMPLLPHGHADVAAGVPASSRALPVVLPEQQAGLAGVAASSMASPVALPQQLTRGYAPAARAPVPYSTPLTMPDNAHHLLRHTQQPQYPGFLPGPAHSYAPQAAPAPLNAPHAAYSLLEQAQCPQQLGGPLQGVTQCSSHHQGQLHLGLHPGRDQGQLHSVPIHCFCHPNGHLHLMPATEGTAGMGGGPI